MDKLSPTSVPLDNKPVVQELQEATHQAQENLSELIEQAVETAPRSGLSAMELEITQRSLDGRASLLSPKNIEQADASIAPRSAVEMDTIRTAEKVEKLVKHAGHPILEGFISIEEALADLRDRVVVLQK